MKKVFVTIILLCATTMYAQDWVKDGNGIPDRVAINEFIVLNNDLYACGHYISEQFTSEARLYKTSNDGKDWSQVPMKGLETKTMNTIFDFNGTLFSAGALTPNGAEQKYGVYSSKDNGASWAANGKGIPERVAVNEFIVIGEELYACGHFISPQFTSEVRIYKLNDNGANWEQVATPGLKTLTGNAIFDYKGTLFVSGSTNQMSPQYGVYIKK